MAVAKAFLPFGSHLSFPGALLVKLSVAGLVLMPTAGSAQQPLPEAGVWIDDSGSGAVEIYNCAERTDRLCGRIVWLKEPLNAQGAVKRDRYNPNEALQKRSICGLPVLGNLAKVPEGGFDGGWIYDPKQGKSYSAAVQRAQGDRLVVTGYVGLKFLSKSFTWTRAPVDLQRCQGAPQSAQTRKPVVPAVAAIEKPIRPAAKLQAPAAAEKPAGRPAAEANLVPSLPTPGPKATADLSEPAPTKERPIAAPKPVAAKPPPAKKPAAGAATASSAKSPAKGGVPKVQAASADGAPTTPTGGAASASTAKSVAKPSAAQTSDAKSPVKPATSTREPNANEVTGFSWE